MTTATLSLDFGTATDLTFLPRSVDRVPLSLEVLGTGSARPMDVVHDGTTIHAPAHEYLQLVGEAPADQLAGIRSAFGLNVTDLARILLVERPTIYSWMSGMSLPVIANRRRINEIAGLASAWTARSGRPLGDRIRQPLGNDESLLDVLSQQQVALVDAMAMLDTLATTPIRVREGLRRRGVPFVDADWGDAEIRRHTGRTLPQEDS